MSAPVLSLALLHQVNQLADRFEADWRDESPPSLEATLGQAPVETQPELFRATATVARPAPPLRRHAGDA